MEQKDIFEEERFKNMEKHFNEIPKFRKLLNYDKFIEKIQARDEIVLLVNKLHWDMPEDEQKSAIETIKSTVAEDDYDLLIFSGHTFTWPNIVEILKEVGYPKNKKALPSLISLLKDLNWPGAREGMSVLKEADKSFLIPILEVAIEEAHNTNDGNWLAWIKEFLEFAEINKSDFINGEVYDLLEYADW